MATDYSGLGTEGALAYLDGPAAGANAIDVVRAAHEVYGDVLDERWMVAGLSEGGHAAYFAGHEASSRAPGLDFRGTVVVAGPTHLEGLFPLGGPLFPEFGIPGLVVYVLYLLGGIDDQRPEENVRQYLSPLGISWMEKAATQCAVDIGRTVASERVPLGASLFSIAVDATHLRTDARDASGSCRRLRPAVAHRSVHRRHNPPHSVHLGATRRSTCQRYTIRVSRNPGSPPQSVRDCLDGSDCSSSRSELCASACGGENRCRRFARTTLLPRSRTGCRRSRAARPLSPGISVQAS